MDANAFNSFMPLTDDVSIHAPVMDAKVEVKADVTPKAVSIHAPVMDANTILKRMTDMVMFQSTRP